MGVFRDYLGGYTSLSPRTEADVDRVESDAAEIVRHGIQSMIAEGQDPHEVYRRAFPIFGENFLEKAGVVDLVAEARETK